MKSVLSLWLVIAGISACGGSEPGDASRQEPGITVLPENPIPVPTSGNESNKGRSANQSVKTEESKGVTNESLLGGALLEGDGVKL